MSWRLLCGAALLYASSASAITASSYIAMDLVTGAVLIEHAADAERPIASITKLLTTSASSVLDPNEGITILRDDVVTGRMRSTPLRVGVSYPRHQLIELALVSSDNVAAMALGRTGPNITSSFATVVEPSGLNQANTSSARKLAKLASSLYDTDIAVISTHPTANVGQRRNTNPLLTKPGWEFYLSKTGFIRSAGGCLVTITKVNSRLTIIVLLGASSVKQRWRDLIDIRRSLGDTGFYALHSR